jgi:hypothetical protein
MNRPAGSRSGFRAAGLAWLALAACGPRPAPAPPPPPAGDPAPPAPSPATVEALGTTTAGTAAEPPAPGCRVVDEEVELVEGLVVTADGVEPFRLDAHDAAVAADFAPGAVPTVRVRGALEFAASAPTLPLRPAAGALTGGGVTVSRDSTIPRAVADGQELLADVALGLGVTVRGARLPCAGLEIDFPRRVPHAYPKSPPGEPALHPATLPLRLADGPTAEPTLTVEADDPVYLPFLERDRQGDSVLVALEWTTAAALSGWAPRAAFVVRPASGFGGPSGGGEPSCPRPGSCGGSRLYCGPADVATGATVFAEPDAGPWATVRDGWALEVTAVTGEEWVRVRRVPGLTEDGPCGDLQHAWVARDKVHLPGDESRPRPGACEDGATGLVALPQEVHLPCESLVGCPDSVAVPTIVRNCSAEPVELVQLEFHARSGGAIRRWEPVPGSILLAPGERFEDSMLWGAGEYELRVRGRTADGFPFEGVPAPLTIRNLPREAAQAACDACNGTWGRWGIMGLEGCDCPAQDAGDPCTSDADCEGRCMFDGWVRLDDDDPEAAAAPACAEGQHPYLARGTCSERTAIFGCVSVLGEVSYDCRRPGVTGRAPHVCID